MFSGSDAQSGKQIVKLPRRFLAVLHGQQAHQITHLIHLIVLIVWLADRISTKIKEKINAIVSILERETEMKLSDVQGRLDNLEMQMEKLRVLKMEEHAMHMAGDQWQVRLGRKIVELEVEKGELTERVKLLEKKVHKLDMAYPL